MKYLLLAATFATISPLAVAQTPSSLGDGNHSWEEAARQAARQTDAVRAAFGSGPSTRRPWQVTPSLVDSMPAMPLPIPRVPWIHAEGSGIRVNLAYLWAPEPRRNQGLLGTCAAFAAVALFEAAVSRVEHRDTRLSEADLFLQAVVPNWNCWRDGGCSTVEGANVSVLVDHVRSRGVLLGDDYAAFTRRFVEAVARSGPATPPSRLTEMLSFLTNPFQYGYLFNMPREEAREFIEHYHREFGTGDYDRVRGAVAADLARYTPVRDAWNADASAALALLDCLEAGARQRAFIDRELLAGRPVAVEMALAGLDSWDGDSPADGKGLELHAFVINGAWMGRDSKQRIYYTRNSWGGRDPLVMATYTCRIQAAESLLGPGETPSRDDAAEYMAGHGETP